MITTKANILNVLQNLYFYKNEPISLVHFVTNRCNARCSFCFIDFENPNTFANELTLNEIEKLNMILDVTHLCDQSFWEAIDHYNGKMWASHSNCRSLVPNQRQFSNLQIKELIARKAIIGMAFDAWMMIPKWQKGISDPKNSDLVIETIIGHIDHICQLSGNSDHIALGTDLDGGFGKEQCPYDLKTISDLQKMDVLLKKRGYSENDIQKILNQNAINFLMGALP